MDTKIVSADKALEQLKEGNQRFVDDALQHADLDVARREELTGGQRPMAVVVACADSRVIPEVLFDQGLGRLFVIRVAGNVARNNVLGSIEYAVANLNTKLVVVLGHEKCGAVTAALDADEKPGHVGSITDLIKPAVYLARHQQGDVLENSIKNNATMVKEQISDCQPILHEAVQKNGVKVVSGYYNLASGKVDFLNGEG